MSEFITFCHFQALYLMDWPKKLLTCLSLLLSLIHGIKFWLIKKGHCLTFLLKTHLFFNKMGFRALSHWPILWGNDLGQKQLYCGVKNNCKHTGRHKLWDCEVGDKQAWVTNNTIVLYQFYRLQSQTTQLCCLVYIVIDDVIDEILAGMS